jgi:hypothetical protein
MIITNAKAEQLMGMMIDFAKKYDLLVVPDLYCGKDNREYSEFTFFRPLVKDKRYYFFWEHSTSLSEGAAYIFADVINDFNLNSPPAAQKKYLKNMAIEAGLTQYELDVFQKMGSRADMGANPFEIKDVIFHDPATIVKWADGTKTVVKAQEGDIYDPEKGLAMAITKKALGNKGDYNNEIKKWLSKYKAPANAINPIIEKLNKVIRDQIRQSLYNHPIKFVKEGLNSIYGRPAMKKDIVLEVNNSIENSFTKDRLD